MSDGLRIVELKAENVKRLTAITITPFGDDSVVIGGPNGAGKSSAIDAIAYAMGGESLIPEQPIREGETSAKIRIDLGEFIVERRFTAKGSTLVVTSADGRKYPSPQSVLNKLVGDLSFDPLAFASMKPLDQMYKLKQLVDVEFDDLDEAHKLAFEDRTLVNREVKRLQSQLEAMHLHTDVPATFVSTTDLIKEAEDAETSNRRIDDYEALGRKAATLREELDAVLAEMTRAAIDLTVPTRIETAEIRERIQTAEAINQKIRDNEKRAEVATQLKAKSDESEALSDRLIDITADKETRLATATFPVDGLSFGDMGVLYNGLPLEQAAASEKFRVSIAMGMALNPRLKVMLMRDASLLDDENLRTVMDLCREKGYQAWIERVGKGAEVSVIIEDGAVAA